MRLIFMGTPDFAVPTLDALVHSEHEVAAVYTQQDKPQGRSGKPVPSPVKVYAEAAGIPVLQPASFRKAEVLEEMRGFSADAIIVVAFSRILKKRVLEMTPYGCFNVHASLLPRYRGAAPVQWAILEGEQETGVTIMQMDEGLDTGDILNQVTIPIEPDETGDSLFEKLSRLGGPLLLETLKEAEAGELHPVKQGESPTVYAAMLDKSMGRIDFSRDAAVIERYIRGLYSWPSAYTDRDGKILKIYKAEVVEEEAECPAEVPAAGEAGETDGGTCACTAEQSEAMDCPACAAGTEQSEAIECPACASGTEQPDSTDCPACAAGRPAPGTVIRVTKKDFTVQCGRGALKILELQPEGKRRMRTADYLRGNPIPEGTRLGQG